jgi:hypothetical protein
MSGLPIHCRSEIPRIDPGIHTRYSGFSRTIINGIDLADQKKERNREATPRIYQSGRDISLTFAFARAADGPAIVAPAKV